MKQIVLFDVWCNYLDSILSMDDIKVKMLVTENLKFVDKCKEKYGDKVENYYYRIPFTNEEFEELNKSDYNLTYEDIEEFRNAQLKCEHYLHREILDDGNVQYRYFLALKYWLGFFKNNTVDALFVCHSEHGGLWDALPIEIAKKFNIPVYAVTTSTGSKDYEIDAITKLNDLSFIKLDHLNLNQIDLKSHFESIYKVFKKAAKKTNFSPKKWLKDLKNLLGYLKYTFLYSEYKRYKKRSSSFVFWGNLNRQEIFQQKRYISKLRKLYSKLSVKPNFDGVKYIYYPLHQEPEASIMTRSIMTSQLFVIKLISETLPAGWKLYVKEHPGEFLVYDNHPYFLRNINYFRSPDFYRQIKLLDNVELIDINADSRELLSHASANCSICGTSLIESVIMHKPILIFGKSLTFVELLKDSFVIDSRDALCAAMDKIYNGFEPNYDDFLDVYKEYTFSKNHYGTSMWAPKNDELVKLLDYLIHRD